VLEAQDVERSDPLSALRPDRQGSIATELSCSYQVRFTPVSDPIAERTSSIGSFVPSTDMNCYSITSSAWTSNEGGMVMPSALAVFMLITSSNLVGCCTGRSAGLAPLRILST
jgi:hypothetical protein